MKVERRPQMFNLMCPDTKAAKLNRERVESDFGGAFYAQQAHAVAQWEPGEEKPSSVIVGELPYVGRAGRVPKYIGREDD